MENNAVPRPLSGPLRSRLNKLAHVRGQRHEAALRTSMQSQLEQARANGESLQQLCERMARFEVDLDA